MKKMLSIFLLMWFQLTSVLVVVSCALETNYSGLFEPKKPETNNGDYLIEDYADIVKTFSKVTQQLLVVETPVRSEIKDPSYLKILLQNNRETILDKIIERCEIDDPNITIEIYEDNSFTIPKLIGFDNENQSLSEIEVEFGTARLALRYLDKTINVATVTWNVPEFELLSKVTNILNQNSFQKVGEYAINKIDLPIFDFSSMGFPIKLTFGTIASILSILNLTNGDFSSSSITGQFEPVIKPIQKIMGLNVGELGNLDPTKAYGKFIYEMFDDNFRSYIKEFFLGIETLLTEFGLPTTLTFGEDKNHEPKTYQISEILNSNVFEILGLDLTNINIEQTSGSTTAYMNVEIGSKGKVQQLKLIDLLTNIAPNLVKIFGNFLNPKSYDLQQNGTHNMLFLVLKELLTDMDADLLALRNRNNFDNKSAYNAKSGLDSLLFNLLIDYNKARRTAKTVNLYIKLRLDVNIPLVGITNIFDDLLDSLLNKMNINPGDIVLQIINNLFDLQGQSSLDINTPFLSPNKKMVFLTPADINIQAVVNDIGLSEWVKPLLTPFYGLITDMIVNNVNDQINAMIPTVSMLDLINEVPQHLLGQLELSPNMINISKIKILQADFVFQFYNPVEDTWNSITKGISAHSFSMYQSLKIKFMNVKFKIEFKSETNGEFIYYTKPDLCFVIIFADTDIN